MAGRRRSQPPKYRSPPASMAKFSNGWSSRAAMSIANPFATAPRSSSSGRCSVMRFLIVVDLDVEIASRRSRRRAVYGRRFRFDVRGRSRAAPWPVRRSDRRRRRSRRRPRSRTARPRTASGSRERQRRSVSTALQLALRIEAAAGGFDVLEPGDGARDRVVARRAFHVRCAMTDDLKADHRAHHGDRVDVGVAHFAFFSASATA